LADLEIEKLFQNGHRIIVVEAAVLLEASWQTNMNEIWVVFVPHNEVAAFVEKQSQ
jgi:phosphopantetheine adenylyltransferase/dephospho-CoA kinase